MPTSTLEGKTALVTGGAKRIGASICRSLADAGCKLIVHARSSMHEAEALANELGGRAVQADLGDPDDVDRFIARLGPVDLLVNNASAFPRRTLAEASYDDLDGMMRLHAWAPLALARHVAASAGSAVVNMLDTRVASVDPEHMPYHLSKQALRDLTRTLARTLAPVRVNGVAPGPILPPTDGSDGANAQAAIKATLLGREGTPEEVAAAVRFLLESEYVTGNILYVDGGRHLRG